MQRLFGFLTGWKKQGAITLIMLGVLALLFFTGCNGRQTLPGADDGGSGSSAPVSSEESGSSDQVASGSEAESTAPEASDSETSSGESTAGDASAEESAAAAAKAAEEAAAKKRAAILAVMESLSLEERVGQLILGRFPGPDAVIEDIENYHIGGFVLFAVDFEGYTEAEVLAHIEAAQQAALADSGCGMIIAVDEEGGWVTRVSQYFGDHRFASPRSLYETGGFEAIEAEEREKCALLSRFHINMNLAPVCDVTPGSDEYMYDRSMSGDPELVSEFVRRVIPLMQEAGITGCLKHFPGYGDNLDTHTGIAIDERTAESFFAADLLPFRAGIEAGARCIMVSHNIVTAFDDAMPASLSGAIHRLAREELGFEGVLMTDDLDMGAILDFSPELNPAVQALLCGNDLAVTSSYREGYEAILEALEAGILTEEIIDEALYRVLSLKYDMGLLLGSGS